MPLSSTLRPLVSKDPTIPIGRAENSTTRSGVLVYPSSNAQKNYGNCANCASSRQACVTDPPYSPTLCKKCARQGRIKCPPHMSTTDAALWRKRDKEKRPKNKVTGTVDKPDGAGTEVFNSEEIGTSLQSVPPEESASNQPENVIECSLDTVTSHATAQHNFEADIWLREPLHGSHLPPDIQVQQNDPESAPQNHCFESNLDNAYYLPQADSIDASPPPLWPDDQRFLTSLNFFS